MIRKVLNCGEIELIETFGDELTVVNSARVSFHKQKLELDDDDCRLLKYLIRHHHTSPFRHVFFRFRIKAPEFVLRQWFKHVVGAEWTSCYPTQLHGWNEVSGRYVKLDEYYIPDTWRKQSTQKKQGSDGYLDEKHQKIANEIYSTTLTYLKSSYDLLLKMNVANEMARIMLPLSIYTETMWTVSLQAVLHFIGLRVSNDTQEELRLYANAIEEMIKDKFPHIVEYWLDESSGNELFTERLFKETVQSHKQIDSHEFVKRIRENPQNALCYIRFNESCIFHLQKTLNMTDSELQNILHRKISTIPLSINSLNMKKLLQRCEEQPLCHAYMFYIGLLAGGKLLSKYIPEKYSELLLFEKDSKILIEKFKTYLNKKITTTDEQDEFIHHVNSSYALIKKCFDEFAISV